MMILRNTYLHGGLIGLTRNMMTFNSNPMNIINYPKLKLIEMLTKVAQKKTFNTM